MNIAEAIEAHHAQIKERFAERLYASTAAASFSKDAVIDGMDSYLRALADALRAGLEAQTPPPRELPEVTGKRRLSLGSDLGDVVRDCAVLDDILFEVLRKSGAAVSLDDACALSRFLVATVAEAATAYATAHDHLLQEQAEQHLGFLAHELRNPLSSMRLSVHLGKESGELVDGRVLQVLERGLSRLSQLIDDALVGVRLRQGAVIHRRRLDARALLGDIALDNGPHAEAKGLRLRVDVADGVVVDADEQVLRSALSNLLQNAVKFSHHGGEVTLRARAADGRVLFEVEDSCGGLPPGTVEKLFDPFVQVGSDRSGFGLGLAIARSASRSHGGVIRVHDLPGRGCVFVVELPDPPAAAPATKRVEVGF